MIRCFFIFSFFVSFSFSASIGIFPSPDDLSMGVEDYTQMMALLGMLSALAFFSPFTK